MKLKDCIVCGAPRSHKLYLSAPACCSYQCRHVVQLKWQREWQKRNRERVRGYKAKWLAKQRALRQQAREGANVRTL